MTAAHNGHNGKPRPRLTFGDRLSAAVAERESQIVLGIDPDPAKLWPAAIDRTSEARARLAMTFSDAEEAAGESPPSAGVVARLAGAAGDRGPRSRSRAARARRCQAR